MTKYVFSKRQKFAAATIFLLLAIVAIRVDAFGFLSWRIRAGIFSIFAIVFSTVSLHDEDFKGLEWIMLPILPAFFAISCSLLFPLLPQSVDSVLGLNISPDSSLILSLFVKLVFLAVFIVGYYASLLTSNILNVAAVRSIQLLRVAHSIGFLVTVTSALFFYIVIASFHQSSFVNFAAIFFVTFPLSLQAIWSVNLETKIGEQIRSFSLLIALVLAEIAWVMSFWPVGVSIFALFLAAVFYELVGIVQYHLGEKLSPRIANEFIIVAVAVFLLTIITTVWGA